MFWVGSEVKKGTIFLSIERYIQKYTIYIINT